MSSNLPEPKVKMNEEFEILFKDAEVAYPDMPKFLLRIALQNALREEELQKMKKLPKKKHLLDIETEVEPEYARSLPEEMTIKGIEVIPPQEDNKISYTIVSEDAPH